MHSQSFLSPLEPPALKIPNESTPHAFGKRTPPAPEFQKGACGIGMDIFWNHPLASGKITSAINRSCCKILTFFCTSSSALKWESSHL